MTIFFLDVVEESWLQRNGRDMLILTAMTLIALAVLVGIFLWIKKRRKIK